MAKCIREKLILPACQGRIVEAEFIKKEVSSDGDGLLLREIDRKINFTAALEKIIPDPRNQKMITHSLVSMLQQHIYGIALGYEDLNDHSVLRNDPAIQTAVDRIDTLASSPTLCRMENRANRKMIFDSNALMTNSP
jgi:hypothetical protein